MIEGKVFFKYPCELSMADRHRKLLEFICLRDAPKIRSTNTFGCVLFEVAFFAKVGRLDPISPPVVNGQV